MHESVRYLLCPYCGAAFAVRGATLVCGNGHSFDVARQGYVNLLPSATRHRADSSAMVNARDTFLRAGYYRPLADRLARLAQKICAENDPDGCVVDIGGGTGYYLDHVLNALPSRRGIVLDGSKYAAGRAARAHPRMSAVVADVWDPFPVRDKAAVLVMDIFAPRNGPELRRIMDSSGVLIVVTPNREHLRELVQTLDLLQVDERKAERLAEQLDPYFESRASESLKHTLQLDAEAIELLIAMGPNAWHTDASGLRNRIDQLPKSFTVGASFSINVYRPKARGPV